MAVFVLYILCFKEFAKSSFLENSLYVDGWLSAIEVDSLPSIWRFWGLAEAKAATTANKINDAPLLILISIPRLSGPIFLVTNTQLRQQWHQAGLLTQFFFCLALHNLGSLKNCFRDWGTIKVSIRCLNGVLWDTDIVRETWLCPSVFIVTEVKCKARLRALEGHRVI